MDLVVVSDYIPDAIIDLRYASTNNVTGQRLYNAPLTTAKVERTAAVALQNAANRLREQGYTLVVWDAYRTSQAQAALRAINNDPSYVSDDSNHCKGIAVDITLARSDATYLDMGTDFDEFTERAHAVSPHITAAQNANRLVLRKAMESAGFSQWPHEWWHFDYLQ